MLETQRRFAARAMSSALIIGSGFLTGCQTEYKSPKLSETLKVSENVYSFLQDKFQDPIYRAASLTVFTKDGSYGHGSLIRKEGKLYIYTIAHVADGIVLDGEGYVNIPGIEDSIRKLDPTKFEYHPRRINYEDTIVSYRINDLVSQEIEAAIRKRQLTPLEIDQNTIQPGVLLTVPRGDIGRNTYLRYTGNAPNGTLQLQIDNLGVVCSGRSGGPVLRVVNNAPTNKVVGVLSAGAIDSVVQDPQGLRGPCFGKVIATPID